MMHEQGLAEDIPNSPPDESMRVTRKRTWQDSVAAVDPDHHVHQRQRTDAPLSSVVTRPKASQKGDTRKEQPRWHNQSYMMCLALQKHPDRCLPRTELIKAALEMDKKISQERGLPKVFRGKTPMNSASAILTNNSDRYFIPFKPPGSRSTHFRLAYEPGNPDRALQEYHKWEKMLAEHDWPFCFGTLKPGVRRPSPPPLPSPRPSEVDISDAADPLNAVDAMQLIPEPKPESQTDMETENKVESEVEKPKTLSKDGEWAPTLDQLDLTNVPTSWKDVVRVDDSRIPGAGKGLFAARRLPDNTPLGFYFGVPMTEDEYDSLKDNVGRASEYAIMYRKTVLDATDEKGQPYIDPNGDMFCPFHFMNETDEKGSNISFIEGALVNQVICWTKRVIEEGEELLVWYGKDIDRYWNQGASPIKPNLNLHSNNDNNKSNSL